MFTSLHLWLKRTSRLLPVLLLPLAAHAQAPVNDNPSGAIALPLGTTCIPTSATNVGATTTATVPNGYTNPGCGIATAPKDVWFLFTTDATGPGSTAAAITVAGTTLGQVRMFSSAGGAAGPLTSIGCSSGGSNNSQAPRLVVVGLTPATTYYVSVSGYESTDTQGAFTICATVPVANDAAVEAVLTLTQLPIPQGAPHLVRAVVSNQGSTAQTNLAVTLTVTGPNAFSFTNVQTVAALAPSALATVSFAGYAPTVNGTYTLTVTIPADDNTLNNSRSATQVVNRSTYSYADPGGAVTSFGLGTGSYNQAFACRYSVNSPVSVTQVRPYVVNNGGASGPTSAIGKTVYGVVVEPVTGTLLARSADYVLTAADMNTYVTLPITTQVALPAGTDVLVGMAQVFPAGQTVPYYPLGVQSDGPGRTNAFYVVSTVSAALPGPINGNTGGYKRLMIEAVTAPATPCAPVTALAAGSLTPSSAVLTFAGAPATITYTASDGITTTTVPPTASPATLTGLNPGTTYTVGVSASCGVNASFPTFVTFTTPPAVAPYAPLPYAESFEGPWLSVAAVRDAPTTNWRNTPPTGDRSWRREDDGSSANWASSLGAYAPASSQGTHSARFHTVGSTIGSPATGALDLYVNLSAPGTKTMTFDYINPDGTDFLRVFVSTDGGATFSSVAVQAGSVNTTFTTKTANITSTSATTVIRFRATNDFGLTDLGIDNVRLAVVTATRNEALAATVGLYPNPAHGTFALAVPAGALHAAAATLHNALGQVVQVRQLALPAAGGTTEFDVRGLPAGVYSLRLQTGETLVVKRVVLE